MARGVVLVIAEQRDSRLNNTTWEVISAAQQLDRTIKVAVPGKNIDKVCEELASADVDEVLIVEDSILESYTPDGYVLAFEQVIQAEKPEIVLLSHTYQTRDFAALLAARIGRSIITDCVGFKRQDGQTVYIRPMFQGKLYADVIPLGASPHFLTLQVGAFRADSVAKGVTSAATRRVTCSIDHTLIRHKPESPFKEAKQVIDLTQAERIVAVGRGIKGPEHLELVQQLANALKAEVGASRPICDAGWLPMDRQIGSSGQTVAPKLYIALGISGAIQHLVGIKGSRTIVAINKDIDAPIFEVADFGVAADLFDLVPALIAELGE